MIRSLIMLNICGKKSTEREYASKLANCCQDSTKNPVPESMMLDHIRMCARSHKDRIHEDFILHDIGDLGHPGLRYSSSLT